MGVLRAPLGPVPAAAPRVSLYSSARLVTDDDLRWTGGAEWPADTATGGVTDACAAGTWTLPDHAGSAAADPMVVWAGDRCSAFGWQERDYEARARAALEVCEPALVEAELWSGAQAGTHDWPNLVLSDPAENLSPQPDDVSPGLYALAALQEHLAEVGCGRRGMIHATRNAVTLWHRYGLVRREGPMLLDLYDNVVVPGAGYDGSGPDGEVATAETTWVYATGLLEVRRGPVTVVPGELAEALDRATNTVEWRAWRPVLVSWDGEVHAGIRMQLCELACQPTEGS